MSDLHNKIINGIKLASTGIKSPVLFISEPGLGKTTAIKNYCKENNYGLITVLTSQYSPEDIAGFPVRDGNRIIRLNPDWLDKIINHYEEEPNKPLVLFLDEITTASRSTQGAILNLIFDRKINDYEFPDNLIILSAGNRSIDLLEESDILISPIKTRFAIINLIPALEDYLSFIDNSSNNKKLIDLFKQIIIYLHNNFKTNISEYVPEKVINEFSGRGIYYLTSYLSVNANKINKNELYNYIQYYLGIELKYDKYINYCVTIYNYKLKISHHDLEIYEQSENINQYYQKYNITLEDYTKISLLERSNYSDRFDRHFQVKNMGYHDFEDHWSRRSERENDKSKKLNKFCNNLKINIYDLSKGIIIKDIDNLNKIKEYCKIENILLNFQEYGKSDQNYIDEVTDRWNYLESLNIRGEL